jgi:amidohydrolase
VAPHHHPEFDIDERCLAVGIETLARATLLALDPAAA